MRCIAHREHQQEQAGSDGVQIVNVISGLPSKCSTGRLHISFPISMRELPAVGLMLDCRSDAQSLFLNCSESDVTAAEVIRCIFQRLPPSLQELGLDFCGCRNMTDEAVSVLAASLPSTLKVLQMDLAKCDLLTDVAVAALGQHIPETVQKWALDLCDCTNLRDAGRLRRFDGTVDLEELRGWAHNWQKDDQRSCEPRIFEFNGKPSTLKEVAAAMNIPEEALMQVMGTADWGSKEIQIHRDL
eukprot:4689771-Amphidinium_carterae.1